MDSSVAVKWLIAESDSPLALLLLRETLAEQEVIIVPPLLFSEVTNVMRQRMRDGTFTLQEAVSRLRQLLALPLQVDMDSELYVRALTLTERYDLPAAYDAHYLALAEQHQITLWTTHERFLRALGGRYLCPIAESMRRESVSTIGEYGYLR